VVHLASNPVSDREDGADEFGRCSWDHHRSSAVPAAASMTRVIASFIGLASRTYLRCTFILVSPAALGGGRWSLQPGNVSHALPPTAVRHHSDLGNFIVSDASGNAYADGEFDLIHHTTTPATSFGRGKLFCMRCRTMESRSRQVMAGTTA
jgi:hypothetical protein